MRKKKRRDSDKTKPSMQNYVKTSTTYLSQQRAKSGQGGHWCHDPRQGAKSDTLCYLALTDTAGLGGSRSHRLQDGCDDLGYWHGRGCGRGREGNRVISNRNQHVEGVPVCIKGARIRSEVAGRSAERKLHCAKRGI